MDPRELSAAIQYLTTGTYVAGMTGGEKRKMRRLRATFTYQESIEDGGSVGRLVMRQKRSTKEDSPKVLVKNGHDPSPMAVIRQAHLHSDHNHAHYTFEETVKRVSKEWWWPRYIEEIRDFVRRCERCNTSTSIPSNIAEKKQDWPNNTKGRVSARDLPTMVLPTGTQTYPVADEHCDGDDEEGETLLVRGMSSSSGSISEKTRPEKEEGGGESENEGGEGRMVENDEEGRVTIVIPSEPPITRDHQGQQSTVPRSTLCRECGAVIRNAGNVVVHMRRHLQYRPYHCNLCQYQGYDPDDVRRHLGRLHAAQDHSANTNVSYKPIPDLETQLKDMISSSKTIGGGNGEEGNEDCRTLLEQEALIDGSPDSAPLAAAFSAFLPDHNRGITMIGGNDDEYSVEEMSTCKLCNTKVPVDPVPLLRHLKSHFNSDGYSCPYCTTGNNSVTYGTLRDFEMHLQSASHKTHPTVAKLQLTLDESRRFLCDQISHLAEHVFPSAKMKCQLCSRRITWNRQSLSDHVKEHAGYYPYKCAMCRTPFVDLPALIEHIQRDQHANHKGPSMVRYCPDAKAECDALATFPKCFPLLTAEYLEQLEREESLDDASSVSEAIQSAADKPAAATEVTNTANRSTLRCQLCQAQISRNMSCLIAHAKVHLAYKPLKCDHCNFRHFAMSKIRRHNSRVHGSKPVKVSYHPVPDIGRQIKEMKWQCFGAYGGSTGSPSAAVVPPVQMEEEELRAFQEQDGSKEKPLHVADILKEMVAASSRLPSNGDPSMAQSAVSSLSSLLAERMASLESPLTVQDNRTLHMRLTAANFGMDQPIGNGLGKKLCSLCNAYIANNPSSFENHACKHLDYKPYSCHYCQYQSYIRGKVTRHIQQVHSGEQVKISHKPIPGIRDRIQGVKLACFPFLASLINGEEAANLKGKSQEEEDTEKKEQVNCQLCGLSVVGSTESMECHMVEAHMPCKVYCCSTCSHRTPQLWKAKQHAAGAHAPNVSKYLTCPASATEDGNPVTELTLLRFKCYGADGGQDETETADEKMDKPGDDEEEGGRRSKNVEPVSFQRCQLCSQMVENRSDAIKEHANTVHAPDLVKLSVLESMAFWRKCFPSYQPAELEQIKGNAVGKEWRAGAGPEGFAKPSSHPHQNEGGPVVTASGAGMLRKLICKLCNSTIADNPKSVGIHVKNHLNYKPYRCPFCRYMSCEQSKARRHVEHVHNANGDTIEIHAQENIKERITEMKSRCFPNLGHMSLSEVYGNGDDAATTGSCSPEYPQGNVISSMAPSNLAQSLWSNAAFVSPASASSIFPNLKQPAAFATALTQSDGFILSNPFGSFQCRVCKMANINLEDINTHVQTHLTTGLYQGKHIQNKPYQCSYCGVRFGTDEKVVTHMTNVHPTLLPKFVYQPEALADPDQLLAMKRRCFPEIFVNYLTDLLTSSRMGAAGSDAPSDAEGASMDQSSDVTKKESHSPTSTQVGCASKLSIPMDGRLTCQICDQAVSMNPNSLDVHVKNHLDFKPHFCPYCDYKSCIAGKVKRHLDNVHKNKPSRVDSFMKTSNNLKQIIADMRSACFPTMEGDYRAKTTLELNVTVESLRGQLRRELIVLQQSEDAEECGLEVRTENGWDAFSPPLSKTSPMEDTGDDAALETSWDEDHLSNCGTDTLSDSGAGSQSVQIASSLASGTGAYGKLPCLLCGALVADNPSSLGLHVRNHLDYKPFHCLLCDYKSCIQAKVKRHLRNVHKCPTDEMTYNPVANIRAQVTEMKYKCFQRDSDVSLSGRSSSLAISEQRSSHGAGMDCDDVQRQGQWTNQGDLAQLAAIFNGLEEDEDGEGSVTTHVDCRVCGEPVAGDELSKTKHLTRHLGDYEYRCQYCDYSSFVQAETVKHVTVQHPKFPVRVGRAATTADGLTAAYERLSQQCFPIGHKDKLTLYCALCDEAVANDQMTRLNHSSDHVGRTHYNCAQCGYIHLDETRVKAHISKEHEEQADDNDAIKLEEDRNGEEYHALCFPNWPVVDAAGEQSSNVESDGMDMEEESEGDEEGLEGEDGKQDNVNVGKSGATMMPDGPRYICRLCNTPVSMYASSLYVHVKNHMNYKPYSCSHCDYKSPVKSKVRRHIMTGHRNQGATIIYSPKAGAEQEVLRLKKRCFPEVNAVSTLTSDKVPCRLCQSEVADTPLSKGVHAKNHLDSRPYYCPYCPYRSCLRGETRRHLARQHVGLPVNVGFKPDNVAKQADVDRMVQQCFVQNSEGGETIEEGKQSKETEKVAPVSGSAKRKAPGSAGGGPVAKKEKAERVEEGPVEQQPPRSTVYNLRGNRLSGKGADDAVKLGPAYRDWYCCYCTYKAHSKYVVKQHCLSEHPGRPVEVSEVNKFA